MPRDIGSPVHVTAVRSLARADPLVGALAYRVGRRPRRLAGHPWATEQTVAPGLVMLGWRESLPWTTDAT